MMEERAQCRNTETTTEKEKKDESSKWQRPALSWFTFPLETVTHEEKIKEMLRIPFPHALLC